VVGLVGSASLLFTALELGCQGGVVASRATRRACACSWSASSSRVIGPAAGQLQERITPLDKEIVGSSAGGVEGRDGRRRLYGGPVRPPLAPLSPADRERVSALVRGD